MCIIVDADRLGIFLSDPIAEDAAPIHKWLKQGWGKLVYSTSGKFSTEVGGPSKRRLAEHSRAGRATAIPASEFHSDERQLRNNSAVLSNDPHVLALARYSGTRILYTGDGKLMQDFKNKRLIDEPRGKIYSGKKNADLLARSACLD
ncbi:MAG: hypothetical protein OXQ86_12640 [Gammaproteobacteria bacterium]|nr:hypothetical protein [Gammaproteobacteria bacterium]MDE0414311.1 hypothetical protein [Gammaproteobacteria bacterium]